MAKLENKKVAVLAAEGVEQVELQKPVEALKDAGAKVEIVSLKSGSIKAWDKDDWGDTIDVDKTLDEVKSEDYDALLIPGGVMSPDKLRQDKSAVAFVKAFMDARKPVSVICHGPWMLAEADVVRGRRVTSYPSVRTDLENAGAQWVDEEVVTDNGLVTSRKPADLPAFCKKMIEEIGEGRHDQRPDRSRP